MTENQSTIGLLRAQFQGATQAWLEGAMQDVTPEQARWLPPGRPAPIGAQYGHVATTNDFIVLGLMAGRAPLAMSTFNGKTGLSELPPRGEWIDWARTVQLDLDKQRAYAQAVAAAVDEYLATVADDDLGRDIDMTEAGFGVTKMGELITILILNTVAHTGEIAALKGMQDAKGYPF